METGESASLNEGLEAEPTAGYVQGHGGESGAMLKAFCPFSYKKVAKS